jgi:hypothetical protein
MSGEELPSKEDILAAANAGKSIEPEAQEGEVEYSEIEQQAMEAGWNPEGVEGKPFVSAEEYVARQPIYDELHSLKKELRNQKKATEALKKMQAGIREREREKTIAELKAQRRMAVENDDYDAVDELNDQIASEKANKDAPVGNEVFESWVEENDWYNQDPEMRAYADLIGTGYVAQNEGIPQEQVFKYVENEVKARFAGKFENPKRNQPSLAEPASRGRAASGKGGKHRASELPEEDRSIMRTIVRSGAMTEAEYLKEYFGE